MKVTLPFLFVLFTLSLDAQDSKRIASKLDAVTVYEQGATFSRYATSSIEPGTQTLVFYGLPINLNPSTIQIGSSKELEIVSIAVGNTPFEKREKPAEYLKLESEIEAIFRKKELLSAELEALSLEAQILSKNTQLGGDRGFSLAELQQISAFARDQKRKNEIATQKAKNELNALIKKQGELQNELTILKRPLTMLSGEIIIKVASAKAINTRFNLVYSIQNNASWHSNYNLYFESLEQGLKLHHKAQVYQNTGEDWDQVKLTLVTGNPSQDINMPRLYPRFVNLVYSQRKSNARFDDDEALYEVQITSSARQAAGITSEANNANFASVQQNNQANRKEYQPAQRYSLKSAESENIMLRALKVDASYEYQATPILDPSAYLMAKWENWEQHQLLPGQISIYNQGLFVGNIHANFNEEADSLYISLGKDPQISVECQRQFNKESKSFLGSDKILEYEYKVNLANRKQEPIRIRIFDQVPISQNESITIKSDLDSGAKFNTKTGTITWDLNLNSKEVKSLEFSYEIRYPKDSSINW